MLTVDETPASATPAIDAGVERQSPTPPKPGKLCALQLGLGWFPEQAGGLERFYYDLLHCLPSQNVDCLGLVIGSDAIAKETDGRVTGFAPATAGLYHRWRRVRRAVREELRRTTFDLAVSHFALYTLPVLQMIRHLPLVVHFQGPFAAESQLEGARRVNVAVKYRVERSVYKRADRLIVLCGEFRDILVRDYGIDAGRIRVIPPGIHTERFDIPESRIQARELLGWPTDRPIVLCVRRLVSRMGLEDLIEAAREVRRAVPDALILIAGRGRLQQSLQKRIDDQCLDATVRLLGFVPDEDLPLAYRGADLTVVPTRALEGFGIVAAESLASGTPALVTPVGGLPDAVRGLSNHLVLPDTHQETLADQLKVALRSAALLPSADECRTYVRANFHWGRIAARVAEVYHQAVERQAEVIR